ncbi:hypothetical protein EST38_g706 [Candolleomyces aberdarensis]|uniref:HSP90-domain-containing protein n=1 Tax=Candolleomyces aberdarensis TaxID=2316362 RepID=A0A4Q2DXB7_9AGAR|nr:hypothetical protein EST38_g706 [Candolleomyces aberdarensis]
MSAPPPFVPLVAPPLPPGWTQHIGPAGQAYYYNSQTRESTYIRPLPSFTAPVPPVEQQKKKEKAHLKTVIPGTDWLRVNTTEGNVFYSNKITKQSSWTVPPEIADAVKALEQQEKAPEHTSRTEKGDTGKGNATAVKEGKRKLDEVVAIDEVVSKKAKVEEEGDEEGSDEEEDSEEEDEEMEEWQREAVEQLAREAEEERIRKEEEAKEREEEERKAKEEAEKAKNEGGLPKLNMPQRVDLSLDEAKALFKTLLREKDINPLHPWDLCLPLFISDPRYVLLPSVTARKEAFDEYCRDRARELRANTVKKERQEANPKEEFDKLLKEEVKSTRASWTDFRRTWKKDRRFYGWGRDDKEREKAFREYLKDLSEKKKAAAQKAEADFFALLKEHPEIKSVEKESKEARRERALREREQKVKVKQNKVNMDIEKSRSGLNQEEGERIFKTMLVDAIRDPQTDWEGAINQLKIDPRFTNSPLSHNQQVRLFHDHVNHLRSKQLVSLHTLFEEKTPSLDSRLSDLPVEELLACSHTAKLGYDIHQLENEFKRWQRQRHTDARQAFDEMMSENSFVEFWGRLSKMQEVKLGQGLQITSEDIGEDDEEGNKIDMKALAKTVDIGEMVKVLKRDKRYIVFDHIPEERERWIRSDVARMRKIVIDSLYSHKEIFLRELVSNANDALEKLRITSLKEPGLLSAGELNVTIKAVPAEGGKGGKIIITGKQRCALFIGHQLNGTFKDTGIGMTPEELTTNLGTLAKSGTSDFIKNVEGDQAGGANGNLIGAFGLGFYSSFLVADRVEVASLPPKSSKNANPVQHIFASSADESSFEVYPDPRGNILGRGTEITLFLKPDAYEYLDQVSLAKLVAKHSSFSSSFPVYLFEVETKEVPDEEAIAAAKAAEEAKKAEAAAKADNADEEEAVVEDADDEKKTEQPDVPTPMKNVTVEKWAHLNAQPPLWQRDPKTLDDADYSMFYNGYFKDFKPPLAWTHFSGDSGDGVGFKAILYLPSELPEAFWQKPLEYKPSDIKLLVKRTFITSDLGDNALPKWASWVKVVIDADDLPLNVSRETLQSNRFLKQLKGIILKRLIQLLQKVEKEDPKRWEKVQEIYGSIIKLGAVEDTKHREKLTKLARFNTNQRNSTSFDMYLENKKKGQDQIFYLGEMGRTADELAQSVFAEKLVARGYEVMLLTEPIDEILFGTLRMYKNLPFQDVAKAGLKFGDEDPEEEKAEKEALEEKFKPLLTWLKEEAKDVVRDVVISNRLVKSPCAIVAEAFGYTANVQKMMSASNSKRGDMLHEYAMKAKLLEINPRSPLIEGLLRRVEDLPTDEDERDPETEVELKEAASILIDGALVRSGFDVTNKNEFFARVDRVLRKSLGVSTSAKADETVKPAPPVDPEVAADKPANAQQAPIFTEEYDDGKPRVILPDHMKDKVSIEMEEIDEYGNPVHDEL